MADVFADDYSDDDESELSDFDDDDTYIELTELEMPPPGKFSGSRKRMNLAPQSG